MTEMEGEVESDMSAIHRVDDMSQMGSRRWFRLAPRLFAYPGAVQSRWRMLADDSGPTQAVSVSDSIPGAGGGGVAVPTAPDGTVLLAGPPSPMQGGTVVEATPAALRFSDIGDMFSFSQV